jgi:secreted PhoX family phosphatase
MPATGAATVVVGTDDQRGGQIYVYVGRKGTTGNDVERAGLVGGRLYGVVIDGVAAESDDTTVGESGAPFRLVEIPGASAMTATALSRASDALGVSRMARPEDSAWDPAAPGSLYVATTAAFTETSRLWHLTFTDPSDVTAGGIAQIAVSGPKDVAAGAQDGPRMMDNITVDRKGRVFIQEDAAGEPYLSGIYEYDAETGGLARLAEHDPDRFLEGSPGFLTEAEESSGIIPAVFLGSHRFLLTSQAHYLTGDAETFQGGQLLLMKVPGGRVR